MTTNPLRDAARRLARLVPDDRRVKGLGGAKGRRRLQLRKLGVPLFGRPVILTARDGLRLRVGTDPVDELIAQHVLGPRRTDYFPPWPDGPPKHACILDIGAHHGLFAAAALHAYPDSRIICVEPSVAALDAVRANLELNGFAGRARIVNAGLAAQVGEGALRHSSEGSWGASLFEEDVPITHVEPVALETLDAILEGERPDIIKCNAEGAEFTLFDQIQVTTIRPAFMVVMVHPDFGDMDRLVEQGRTMGYDVTRIGTPERPAFHMWRVS